MLYLCLLIVLWKFKFKLATNYYKISVLVLKTITRDQVNSHKTLRSVSLTPPPKPIDVSIWRLARLFVRWQQMCLIIGNSHYQHNWTMLTYSITKSVTAPFSFNLISHLNSTSNIPVTLTTVTNECLKIVISNYLALN